MLPGTKALCITFALADRNGLSGWHQEPGTAKSISVNAKGRLMHIERWGCSM